VLPSAAKIAADIKSRPVVVGRHWRWCQWRRLHGQPQVRSACRLDGAYVPSQRTGAIQRSWVWTYVAALSGAFVSGLMFDFPSPASAVGVLILGGSIALALRQPAEIRSIDKIISQATQAWKNIEAKWNEVKDSHQFLRCRSEADEVIRNSQNLGREEASQLADLKVKQREAQLQIFLQRFYIERAKIKGIGNTRKVMLRSYGIETAADVELHRVQAIRGFGPVIAGNLVAWRRSVEKRFMFDPNQPINPTDIAAVKTAIAKKGNVLETDLRQSLSELKRISGEINSVRNTLRNAARNIWSTHRQAEMDKASLGTGVWSRKMRLAGIGAAVVVSLVLQTGGFDIYSKTGLAQRLAQNRVASPNQSVGNSTETDRLVERRGDNVQVTSEAQGSASPNSTLATPRTPRSNVGAPSVVVSPQENTVANPPIKRPDDLTNVARNEDPASQAEGADIFSKASTDRCGTRQGCPRMGSLEKSCHG
jgi:hypothetical protein